MLLAPSIALFCYAKQLKRKKQQQRQVQNRIELNKIQKTRWMRGRGQRKSLLCIEMCDKKTRIAYVCVYMCEKVCKNRFNNVAQRAGGEREREEGERGDSGGVCRVIASAAAPSQHIKRNYRKSIGKYDNKCNNNKAAMAAVAATTTLVKLRGR